jgi:hypothetical protein
LFFAGLLWHLPDMAGSAIQGKEHYEIATEKQGVLWLGR